jgi:hypothetical protein
MIKDGAMRILLIHVSSSIWLRLTCPTMVANDNVAFLYGMEDKNIRYRYWLDTGWQ